MRNSSHEGKRVARATLTCNQRRPSNSVSALRITVIPECSNHFAPSSLVSSRRQFGGIIRGIRSSIHASIKSLPCVRNVSHSVPILPAPLLQPRQHLPYSIPPLSPTVQHRLKERLKLRQRRH